MLKGRRYFMSKELNVLLENVARNTGEESVLVTKAKEFLALLKEQKEDCNVRQAKNVIECIIEKEHWRKKGFEICDMQKEGSIGYGVESPHLFGSTHLFKWTKNSIICNCDKQPEIDRWLLCISFSTGAYIFGDDYDTETFDAFFKELIKTYKPEFIDYPNNKLFWYIEDTNAPKAASSLTQVYDKYLEKHQDKGKQYEIERLQAELDRLKGNKK